MKTLESAKFIQIMSMPMTECNGDLYALDLEGDVWELNGSKGWQLLEMIKRVDGVEVERAVKLTDKDKKEIKEAIDRNRKLVPQN